MQAEIDKLEALQLDGGERGAQGEGDAGDGKAPAVDLQ